MPYDEQSFEMGFLAFKLLCHLKLEKPAFEQLEHELYTSPTYASNGFCLLCQYLNGNFLMTMWGKYIKLRIHLVYIF